MTSNIDLDRCARCGRSLVASTDEPAPDRARKWENRAGTLNAVSLLLIPLVLWLDELSATVSLLGALANVVAGIAWIVSGVKGPKPQECWAFAGVLASGFVASVFLTLAVWASV